MRKIERFCVKFLELPDSTSPNVRQQKNLRTNKKSILVFDNKRARNERRQKILRPIENTERKNKLSVQRRDFENGAGFDVHSGVTYIELGDIPFTIRYSDYNQMF